MLARLTTRIVRLPDGCAVAIRPAQPGDAPSVQAFVRMLSPLARRRRFLGALSELSPAQLDRLVRPHDPRDLSLVAVSARPAGGHVVAMAQYALDDASSAEFALVVGDAWQGQGLGERLLERLLARAAGAGVHRMGGFVLAGNAPMLALAAKLGFDCAPDRDPELVRIEKRLPPKTTRLADRLWPLVAPRAARLLGGAA